MFQALIAIVLINVAWFASSPGLDTGALWAVRIGAIAVGYAAVKCGLIQAYMNRGGG